MQAKIETVVDDPISGLMLTYNDEPLIVISPVNHAGWRRLSCVLPNDVSASTFLKEVQDYVSNELKLYRNNKMEYWRWEEELIEEDDGQPFEMYSINLRSNVGEEE